MNKESCALFCCSFNRKAASPRAAVTVANGERIRRRQINELVNLVHSDLGVNNSTNSEFKSFSHKKNPKNPKKSEKSEKNLKKPEKIRKPKKS